MKVALDGLASQKQKTTELANDVNVNSLRIDEMTPTKSKVRKF